MLCEYYMSLGVPYDEFWHGDYCKLKYYEKQFYDRQRQKNYEMWMQGVYFYRAIDSVICQRFGGDANAKYPQLPYGEEGAIEAEKTPEQLQQEIYAQLKATVPQTRG